MTNPPILIKLYFKFATLLFEAGFDIRIVMELPGQKDVKPTMRFVGTVILPIPLVLDDTAE
jgi:hypothetical protein